MAVLSVGTHTHTPQLCMVGSVRGWCRDTGYPGAVPCSWPPAQCLESKEGRKETCTVGFAAARESAGGNSATMLQPTVGKGAGRKGHLQQGWVTPWLAGALASPCSLPKPADAGVSSSSPQARRSQGCHLWGAAHGHQLCQAPCQANVASRSIRGSASLGPSHRAAGGRARASRGHPPGSRPPRRSKQGPAPWGRPGGLVQAEEWGLQQVLSANTSKETRGPRLFWRLISAPHRGLQEGRRHVPAASAVPTGQD